MRRLFHYLVLSFVGFGIITSATASDLKLHKSILSRIAAHQADSMPGKDDWQLPEKFRPAQLRPEGLLQPNWLETHGRLPLEGEKAAKFQDQLMLLDRALSPTGIRTEVYYYQQWNGTDYETYEKLTITWSDWDEADYLWEELYQAWDSENSQWLDSRKYTYTHEDIEDQTVYQYTYEEWDTSTGEKTDGYRWTYTYNTDGNFTQYLGEEWDPDASDWVYNYRDSFTHDTNGNVTVYISEYWDSDASNWINSHRSTSTYDDNDNQTQSIFQYWDSDASDWVNSSRSTYTYDTNGNQTLSLGEYWDSDANDWVNGYRSTYTYDTNGNRTQYLSEYWNSDANDWINSYRNTYTYDTDGNRTEQLNEDWDSDLSDWVNDYRYTYTYDANGFRTLYQRENWDTIASDWVDYWRYTYTCDAYGNWLLEQYEEWDTSTGEQTSGYRYTYTFDIAYSTPAYVYQEWDSVGEAWVNVERLIFVESSDLGVEGIAALPATPSLHQNYPNPFNPATTIRYDLPAAMDVTIIVYDLVGREVVRLVEGHLRAGYHQVVWQGRTAAGREMPSGIYLARLVAAGSSKTIKMVLMK